MTKAKRGFPQRYRVVVDGQTVDYITAMTDNLSNARNDWAAMHEMRSWHVSLVKMKLGEKEKDWK